MGFAAGVPSEDVSDWRLAPVARSSEAVVGAWPPITPASKQRSDHGQSDEGAEHDRTQRATGQAGTRGGSTRHRSPVGHVWLLRRSLPSLQVFTGVPSEITVSRDVPVFAADQVAAMPDDDGGRVGDRVGKATDAASRVASPGSNDQMRRWTCRRSRGCGHRAPSRRRGRDGRAADRPRGRVRSSCRTAGSRCDHRWRRAAEDIDRWPRDCGRGIPDADPQSTDESRSCAVGCRPDPWVRAVRRAAADHEGTVPDHDRRQVSPDRRQVSDDLAGRPGRHHLDRRSRDRTTASEYQQAAADHRAGRIMDRTPQVSDVARLSRRDIDPADVAGRPVRGQPAGDHDRAAIGERDSPAEAHVQSPRQHLDREMDRGGRRRSAVGRCVRRVRCPRCRAVDACVGRGSGEESRRHRSRWDGQAGAACRQRRSHRDAEEKAPTRMTGADGVAPGSTPHSLSPRPSARSPSNVRGS